MVRCPYCEEPSYLLLSVSIHLGDAPKGTTNQSGSPNRDHVTDATLLADQQQLLIQATLEVNISGDA